MLECLKLSTFFVDKIQAILYALAHMKLGPLRLFHILEISYDGDIESRMLQRRITRDRHKDCKVRQELYPANQYEKPRQDAGVFLLSKFLKLKLDGHLKYELKLLQGQSDNDCLIHFFGVFRNTHFLFLEIQIVLTRLCCTKIS